jgi:hypothetical protein
MIKPARLRDRSRLGKTCLAACLILPSIYPIGTEALPMEAAGKNLQAIAWAIGAVFQRLFYLTLVPCPSSAFTSTETA